MNNSVYLINIYKKQIKIMCKSVEITECNDDQLNIFCIRSKNASCCKNVSIDADFEQKAQKLLNKKFVINSQFDQDGTYQFLNEKYESLKEIVLDDIIEEKKQKNHKISKITNDSHKKKLKTQKDCYKNSKNYLGLSSFIASTQTLKQIVEEMSKNSSN